MMEFSIIEILFYIHFCYLWGAFLFLLAGTCLHSISMEGLPRGEALALLDVSSLQEDIEKVLFLTMGSLGQPLAHGYTWKELAQAIHGGSTNKEELLFILCNMIEEGQLVKMPRMAGDYRS